MTELTPSGNYPIEFEEFTEKKARAFNQLWKLYFSMLFPLDTMPTPLREKLEQYTWLVYKEALMSPDIVQNLVDQAYADGLRDGEGRAVNILYDFVAQMKK